MRQRNLAALFAAILIAALSMPALADDAEAEDTDTRLFKAKVVEVTDARISVITRAGVEHVIAVDDKGTKVLLEGKAISFKELREGDVVTVELDALNPVKFAKNIEVANQEGRQVARAKP